jgi:hypothetical protein
MKRRLSQRNRGRFVQLAMCIASLYALDELGRVWQFDAAAGVWRALPKTRKVGRLPAPARATRLDPNNCGVPDGPAGLTRCGEPDCPKCFPSDEP